jgi:hypothetical protein
LRLHDTFFSSYTAADESPGTLARLVPQNIRFDPTEQDRLAARLFAQHRFDLLGSGWTKVRHGMACRGFEGVRYDSLPAGDEVAVTRTNRRASKAARAMLSETYELIDWQLDFKSGFRWSERTWYREIRYGHHAAVDIKVPWELSRMQHLPELAVEYAAGRDPVVAREFRDQLIDWVAANPPRFGVNWACTMDVGIRIGNVLLALDLFRACGVEFDPDFLALVTASALDHAKHIADNLEWSETTRANHYFGNIGGLLVASAYLPASPRTDAWLLFAIQELDVETQRQFLPDGGHFEASTSYHRLCAEIAAVCAVVVSAISEERIDRALRSSEWKMKSGPGLSRLSRERMVARFRETGSVLSAEFYARLSKAADLTRDLSRADGSVPLIGDDDSGRFVRLGGWVAAGTVRECRDRFSNLKGFDGLHDDDVYVVQSAASHQQWLAWASAALGRADLLDPSLEYVWRLPATLACAMMRAPAIVKRSAQDRVAPWVLPSGDLVPRKRDSATHRISGAYRTDGDLLKNVRYRSYPFFGVYIVRSDRMHLVIRCGCAVHDGNGVHAHEDQLSFELVIDGRPVTRDPGTYVYTASKELRNAYRCAYAHCAPSTGDPRNPEARPIFSRPQHARGECLAFSEDRFVGRTSVNGGEAERTILFHADGIEVHDQYWLRPDIAPACTNVFRPAAAMQFSPAYGVRYA